MDKPTCSIGGCDAPASLRGISGTYLCGKHNWRLLTYGSTDLPESPQALCSVGGCGRPVKARGWCRPHWRRWNETGDIRADIPIAQVVRHAPDASCAVEGCKRKRQTSDYCLMHYKRWKKYGDPLKVAWIKGDDRARFESHVDRSGGPDACHLWTGAQDQEGYGLTSIVLPGVGKVTIRSHLLAWEFENGPRPEGSEMDHECHNQAIRDGSCRPGKCPHRLCCNLRHLIQRADRQEHHDATPSMAMRARPVGNRKLTDAQARELVARLKDATSAEVAELARLFGISVEHARRIKRGKVWWWLDDAA